MKRSPELSELKTQHQDLMHVRKSMIGDRLAAEVVAEMGRAAQAQQRLHAELDAEHSMRDELQRQAAELREELKEKSEALASANAQVQDKISEVAALAGSLQEQQMLKDRADVKSAVLDSGLAAALCRAKVYKASQASAAVRERVEVVLPFGPLRRLDSTPRLVSLPRSKSFDDPPPAWRYLSSWSRPSRRRKALSILPREDPIRAHVIGERPPRP